MARDGNADARNDWILDCGASGHLVNDERMFLHAEERRDELSLADAEKLVLNKVEDLRIFVTADGKESTVLLKNVCLAPSVARTIVRYWKIDTNVYTLANVSGKRIV
uniref:Retrovirus-related Pol polyprotein from transposon TNT 1-94-like beta-barrel domain-containing protein n=1 Tax=Peronospora matthiolae TaxID=2874970 RepID=A0AAV1VD94_9STRA